ncbi:MAG TPA: DUF411 domain-containing protein [Burkholderiales bacterium]|nr:DUF411 domain-containing protein [Burkholderiales bacterium]
MATRRTFLLGAAGAMAFAAVPAANAQVRPLVTVYKSPTCGCCGEWEKHMQASGFRVDTHKVPNVVPIKGNLGVPQALHSCHTAIVGGYVLEGHVPASDVKRLLSERPKITGLAVPGMIPGSPGMEQGTPQPYATIAFDDRGTRVFAQH